MNMRLRLPIALALALGSSHASALGLGQIEVKSSLNQPLVAEIPVLASNPGEAEDLRVKLAAPDAFTRVGLDRPTLQAANLQFEVRTDDRGRKVIRITTADSVSDPFLSFLLEADWGKGRMLREYTVLLDPPSMVPIGAAPARTAPLPEPTQATAEPLLETPPPLAAEPVPEPQPEPAPAPVYEAAPEPVPAASAAPEPATASENYPAYGADSYGPVASGDTLWSIAQRTRHDEAITVNQMMLALLRANPEAFADNNINRLRKGAVLRIPAREEATVLAASEAAAQVRDQMQAWGSSSVTFAPPADASMSAPAASTGAADRRHGSRLELTPPRGDASASASQSGAAAEGSGSELRAELARSREEASALSQENVELKSRVGELENLQAESRRLLELKDSELAAAQKRLAEANAAADAAGTDAAVPPPVAPEQAAVEPPPADVADEIATTAPEPATEASTAAPEEAETPPEQTPPAATPEPAPIAQPAAESPAPAPGFNPWIVGGGAAVLLGLIGLLITRRRKQPAAAKTAPSMGAVVAAPAVAAFEPDAQEGDLIEAISHYPDDLHLHLDLLKHYVERGEGTAFEMAAEAMHAQVRDPNDPLWLEAVALGQQIAPRNPLFDTGANYDDFQTHSAPEEEVDPTPQFQSIAPATPAPPSREVDWHPGASAAATHAEISPESSDFDELEFETAPESNAETEAEGFDLDGFGQESAGIDADVAATKLELARAYLDMGDAEGARGMLEEVVSEGNAAQRDEARALIATIR